MVVIRHLPWPDDMCSRKERAQDETKTTNDDVGNAQEVVFASDDTACGDENLFGTAVLCYWEVCLMISRWFNENVLQCIQS